MAENNDGYSISTTRVYDWTIASIPSDCCRLISPDFKSTVVIDQSESKGDSSATSQQLHRFGDPIRWQILLVKFDESDKPAYGGNFDHLTFGLHLENVPWIDDDSEVLDSIRTSGRVVISLLVGGEIRHRTEETEFE